IARITAYDLRIRATAGAASEVPCAVGGRTALAERSRGVTGESPCGRKPSAGLARSGAQVPPSAPPDPGGVPVAVAPGFGSVDPDGTAVVSAASAAGPANGSSKRVSALASTA